MEVTEAVNTKITADEIHVMVVTEAADIIITTTEIHLMEVTVAVDTKITANEIHVMERDNNISEASDVWSRFDQLMLFSAQVVDQLICL